MREPEKSYICSFHFGMRAPTPVVYVYIIRIVIDSSAFSMEYREVESGLADHEARPLLQSVCLLKIINDVKKRFDLPR